MTLLRLNVFSPFLSRASNSAQLSLAIPLWVGVMSRSHRYREEAASSAHSRPSTCFQKHVYDNAVAFGSPDFAANENSTP